MWVTMGANYPSHRTDTGVECSHAVGDWVLGHDQQWARISIETAVMNVSDHADDLSRWFVELWANVFADDNLLPNGIFLRPVFLSEGLVNERHTRSTGRVTVFECTTTQDRNFEHFKIPRRSVHPA